MQIDQPCTGFTSNSAHMQEIPVVVHNRPKSNQDVKTQVIVKNISLWLTSFSLDEKKQEGKQSDSKISSMVQNPLVLFFQLFDLYMYCICAILMHTFFL